jgi:hypothetical protein
MRELAERIGSPDELFRRFGDKIISELRVSIPGIIQSFDDNTQTVTVQPALKERIVVDGNIQIVNLPLLVDVPIQLPRAGNFVLTMPIKAGDECLVVFADMCIDAWFSNSGVQSQIEKRRHDLSDAFAIIGVWSQPNKLTNYSVSGAQLRNEAGTSYVEVRDSEINIVSPVVKINGVVI